MFGTRNNEGSTGASKRWDRALSWTLTILALGLSFIVVRREIVPRASSATEDPRTQWEFLEDWRVALPASESTGPLDAPIHLVEFSDLECPFCRAFHQNINRLLGDAHPRVRYSFVHFPLPRHSEAEPAAHAAECAAQQGRFAAFVDVIFAQQDSLGKKGYAAFARDAQIQDSARFATCLSDSASFARVAQGKEVGRHLGVHMTPTLIINGWKVPAIGRDSAVAQTVRALSRGENPFVNPRR